MSGNSLVDFQQNAPPGGSLPSPGAFSSGIPGYLPAYLSWLDEAGLPQQFVCFVKSEDYDFGADVTEHPVETGSNITDNVRIKLDEAKVFFFETNAPIDSNNWATLAPATSIITIPAPSSGVPLPAAPLEFDAWDNLITERALGATATGAVGNLLGGAMGGAVGTVVGETVLDAVVGGGIPSPQVVFPPPPSLAAVPIPQVVTSQALGFGGPIGLSGPQDFVQQTIALLKQLLTDVQLLTLNGPKLTISTMIITSIHVHRDAETGDAAEIEVGLKQIRFVETTTVPTPAPAVKRAATPVNKGEQGSGDATGQQQSVLSAALSKAGIHIFP